MRERSITALMMLLLLSLPLLIVPMATGAEQKVLIYLETDKAYYKYGDSGKLYITVWNNATGPIEIKNITVTFPWYVLEGRETKIIEDIEDAALSGNETSDPFPVSFTVPAEGRKWWGSSADVKVEYLLGEEPEDVQSSIQIRIEQFTAQSEVLTPIYHATIVIIVLLILTLIALVLMWWRSLRKLTLAPAAPPAPE